MQGVQKFKHLKDVCVHSPNGFANQLRLALAGAFLVRNNYIATYTQEWVLNNHNNVDFLNYFQPLDGVIFKKVAVENSINSTTFEMMIRTYTKNTVSALEALQEVKGSLIPNETVQQNLCLFSENKSLTNFIGIHARRTCKLSFLNLEESKYRTVSKIDSNENVLNKIKDFNNIYLATDNQETQRWFKDRLGERMLVYSTILNGEELPQLSYSRESVTRHTDPLHTVIDFLVLLKVGVFLGTNQSSFSSLIKNIRNNFNDFSFYGKV